MRAKMHRFNLGQRGDTIIEVLIAIAVASTVISLTFATMNRNLLITQSSQERTEASKIAQGQIEALRQIPTLPDPATTPSFCINSDGSTQSITGAPNATATGLTLDDFSKYTGQCTNGFYHIAVTSSNQKDYRIYVRWDRIVGGTRDEIIMVYRL